MRFQENFPERQAAEAIRSRIDWKYLLGLKLYDPGFDFSVLNEFRNRLLQGGVEELLLDNLLECCLTLGLVKAGGKQRTDSTRVLAAIRELNRLESGGETLLAARARGRVGGGPRKSDAKKTELAYQLYDEKKYAVKEICKILSVSKPTLYAYLARRQKIVGKQVS